MMNTNPTTLVDIRVKEIPINVNGNSPRPKKLDTTDCPADDTMTAMSLGKMTHEH